MKRPTKLISKIKHCYNGEFQDLYDYIIFLENLTKTQRAKTIEEFAEILKVCAIHVYTDDGDCIHVVDYDDIDILAKQMKGERK